MSQSMEGGSGSEPVLLLQVGALWVPDGSYLGCFSAFSLAHVASLPFWCRKADAAVEMDEMVAAMVLTSLSCSPVVQSPPAGESSIPCEYAFKNTHIYIYIKEKPSERKGDVEKHAEPFGSQCWGSCRLLLFFIPVIEELPALRWCWARGGWGAAPGSWQSPQVSALLWGRVSCDASGSMVWVTLLSTAVPGDLGAPRRSPAPGSTARALLFLEAVSFPRGQMQPAG